MNNLNTEKVRVACTRPDPLPDGTVCEYEWSTRSKLRTISCPNCRYPNNMAKAIEKAKKKLEAANNGPAIPRPTPG